MPIPMTSAPIFTLCREYRFLKLELPTAPLVMFSVRRLSMPQKAEVISVPLARESVSSSIPAPLKALLPIRLSVAGSVRD